MTDRSPLGLRPRRGAWRTTDRTLTERRGGDGEFRVFAECPNREVGADPRRLSRARATVIRRRFPR